MHRRWTYDFGYTIEVEENFPRKPRAPGEKRAKRKKPTPEQMRLHNLRNKEKRIRRLIKENFRENDLWITLTYKKAERPPDIAEAQKDTKRFFDRVRSRYRKQGRELKWVLHTEIGSRGGIHHHIVMNRIPDADLIIRKAWKKGGAHMALMYEEGGFRELASYMAKEPDQENKLKESRYSRSRNLKVPKPKVKDLVRWSKEPRPKRGYYIEKDSYYEGINPVTGRRYRSYTMIRLNRRI